jgi:hypothetical protein
MEDVQTLGDQNQKIGKVPKQKVGYNSTGLHGKSGTCTKNNGEVVENEIMA